ncbi:MAG: FxsA family protein [Pseudomonadota bacterium]
MWIFFALVVVPIVEIALFIELGGLIGLWPTIALVIGTAVLGAALLRMQGFAAMERLQRSLAEGGDPTGPLAHGALILAAGLLMLTPGFFTDAVGFALLIPPCRAALIAWAGPRLAARVVRTGPGAVRPEPRRARPGTVEDVEYEDLTENAPPPGGGAWSRRPGEPD